MVRDRIGFGVSSLMICCTVAFVALCLTLAANAVTQSLSPAPLVGQLRKAFVSGALPERTNQDLDRQRGALLYNDCLILGMGINRQQSLPVRIVSPALYDNQVHPELNTDTCAILFDVVMNKNESDYRGLPYHRYVAALVPLVVALVSERGVASVKLVLLLLNYAALTALCVAGLIRCLTAFQAGAPWPFYLVLYPLTLMLFGGVEFYAQNLSIGIADLGLYALIAVLFYARPETWPNSALVIIAAAFGSYVGAFEFFTGQIPVLLALPVALLAMRAKDADELNRALVKGLMFSAAAAAAIGLLFMQKIALAFAVAGSDVLRSFTSQLAVRVGDSSFGVGNMIVYMAGRADRIGQGSLVVGLGHALLASLAGVVGLVLLFRRGGFPLHRALTIVASMSVIILWHVVFRNHSTVHSEFMVRSTSFVFASGWVIAGFALQEWRSARGTLGIASNASMCGGPSSPR